MRLTATVILSCWLASAVAGPQAGASIRVQAGDWGAASVQDIEAVLSSVAEVLLPDFPRQAGVRVVVRPSSAGPRVLAVKSVDGAHQVLLNVRDARWDQFAYQFSHELCHVLSNYDRRGIADSRTHQWFEEAVCEAVSVVALQRLAKRWQHAAPHAAWAAYAPAFAQYAEHLMKSEHRHLPAATSFAAWYRENAAPMARDPYLREKNELIATTLAELFQASGLQAVGYLNLDVPASADFAAYLAAWYECCPPEHRPLVQRLITLFSA